MNCIRQLLTGIAIIVIASASGYGLSEAQTPLDSWPRTRITGTVLSAPGESRIPPGTAIEVSLSRINSSDQVWALVREKSFEFAEVPAGEYLLTVKAPGYTNTEILLSVGGQREVHVSANLGPTLEEAGNMPSAMTVRVEEMRIPRKAQRSFRRALSAERRGDLGEAASSLEEALRVHPAFGQAHNRLGALHLREGRFTEAERCFRRASELIPESYPPRKNLGYLLLITGRGPEAVVHLKHAARLRPEDAETWTFLGEALYQSGSPEEATDALRTALQLDPGMAAAAFRLDQVCRNHPCDR